MDDYDVTDVNELIKQAKQNFADAFDEYEKGEPYDTSENVLETVISQKMCENAKLMMDDIDVYLPDVKKLLERVLNQKVTYAFCTEELEHSCDLLSDDNDSDIDFGLNHIGGLHYSIQVTPSFGVNTDF